MKIIIAAIFYEVLKTAFFSRTAGNLLLQNHSSYYFFQLVFLQLSFEKQLQRTGEKRAL